MKISNSIPAAQHAVSLLHKAATSQAKTGEELLKKLHQIKNKIFLAQPYQPILQNSCNYILHKLSHNNLPKLKDELQKRISFVADHLKHSHSRIAECGYLKIRRGMTVYTHCYYSSVLDLLLKAKSKGINFKVNNTEARPYLSGRLMAQQLAKHNIMVQHYPDFGVRLAIKNADVVLLGAKAISPQGQVYAPLGSELVAVLAQKYDVPVYVCADTWKYSSSVIQLYEKMKLRSTQEIWEKPPQKVTVLNYDFEKVDPKLLTGTITELGIHKPHSLLAEIKAQYPWIETH